MWYKYADNPEMVDNIYSYQPLMEELFVSVLTCDLGCEKLTIWFRMRALPDRPPRRWVSESYDTISIKTEFWDVSSFSMCGFSAGTLSISLQKKGDLLTVTLSNENTDIRFTCVTIHFSEYSRYLL